LTEAGAGVDGGRERARVSAPGSDPLARIVFALLVIACFAAFLITQRLKHTPTAVQEFKLTPFFSPYPSGHIKAAAISFKLANASEVTVTIIDSSGNTVATLARNHALARYKTFSLSWNGRRGTAHRYGALRTARGTVILVPEITGTLASAGEYHVRIGLRRHSPVVSPLSVTLVAP
jgi:hypothetical protein